jgi:uncharacterized protein (TIRG00374 family)
VDHNVSTPDGVVPPKSDPAVQEAVDDIVAQTTSPRSLADPPTEEKRAIWKVVAPRLVFMAITLVTLYILWPSLMTVFSSWPELLKLDPLWYPVMLALEAASFICAWGLQRVALRTDRWFGVATAQLSGNAVSRVVPGGAAAGGAVQYKMLTDIGIPGAQVGTGLTAASLISTGALFALPLISVPASLLGRPVPSGLAEAAWLGGIMFVLGFAAGWLMLTNDRALRAVGRVMQSTRNRLFRKREPVTTLPETLIEERDQIRDTLGSQWWKALLFALGNWLFDYLALLAALAAVGAHPRPTLVLLAYSASMVLGMIPITPGGLGFVEAGLTGLLALAGVLPSQAALATLAYRLVSFWLPLPAGGVAAAMHRKRYAHRDEVAPSS